MYLGTLVGWPHACWNTAHCAQQHLKSWA